MTENSALASGPPQVDGTELSGAVEKILNSVVRAELRALLRIEPFFSDREQTWELGWSCRDHAVLIAALLRLGGLSGIGITHGRTMYVQGPTSTGLHGVGMDSVRHSWVHLQGYGDIDISPRLDEKPATAQHGYWRVLPHGDGVCGRIWDQGDRATAVIHATNAGHFDNEVNKATHVTEVATVVYWRQQIDPFAPSLLDCDYVNSPLTHQLRPILGADAYRIIGAHLVGLGNGSRRPLQRISRRKAWRILSEIEPSAVDEFAAALTAAKA